MEIKIIRKIKTEKSSIGEMFIDKQFFCYTLEDKDRGIKQGDSLDYINAHKPFGITAIPTGTYKAIVNKSNRFSQLAGKDIFLPLLLNVPGYEGVRIHGGNKPEDTEGCILLGLSHDNITPDFIGMSKVALQKFMAKIDKVTDINITIE